MLVNTVTKTNICKLCNTKGVQHVLQLNILDKKLFKICAPVKHTFLLYVYEL